MLALLALSALAAAPTPAPAPCRAESLALRTDAADGDFNGMSHGGTWLVVRNTGSTTCLLPGLPTVLFLDAKGQSLPIERKAPPGMHPGPVVIPVALKPGQEYTLSLNSDTFKGFRNRAGEPSAWYPVHFKTRASGAKAPKPNVTSEQNKVALAELRKAIDDNYGYRDRLKVDWAKEIDQRQATFESATSANEFARLAAHLLRLAEDGHVSVEAGEVRIATRANSAPPNSNFQSISGFNRPDTARRARKNDVPGKQGEVGGDKAHQVVTVKNELRSV